MRIAIIGANGQLGNDIVWAYRKSGNTVYELNHNGVDITDWEICFSKVDKLRPDLLINTAAMHHVESCEKDPAKAFLVNGIGAKNLALISRELKIPLVHFSTDYVFDGVKGSPYVEDDVPAPLNVYGKTKLSGEHFIRNTTDMHFIVRVSGLYGQSPCRAKGGLNFVKLMLRLAGERDEVRVIDDEILSPTYTYDIARQLEILTVTKEYGLYHMAAHGSCSWYNFAKKIFEFTRTSIKLNIAHPDEFPAKVLRPKYSVLNNKALDNLDADVMWHWSEGLKRYLSHLGFRPS